MKKYAKKKRNSVDPKLRQSLWIAAGGPVNDVGKPPRPPRRREEPAPIDHGPADGDPAPHPARPTVARSSTMPKDSKLAGWFRKKKRV